MPFQIHPIIIMATIPIRASFRIFIVFSFRGVVFEYFSLLHLPPAPIDSVLYWAKKATLYQNTHLPDKK